MKKKNNPCFFSYFFSGRELSEFLIEHNIHLYFIEGVDGVGKTSLLNDMGVHYTHFPTEHCLKIKNPSPFDYARDIVSTVDQQIKEAGKAAETYKKYHGNWIGAYLYFDRGFMSTLAYSPTIIREYMTTHDPSDYYKHDSWELGQDDVFLNAVELMMKEYIKNPTDMWFARVWSQFISGLLQCPTVHIIYLPSYDSHGLVERIKQRGLVEDIATIDQVGENAFQHELEERLEAYDFMRLLFSTLPMVLHRRDSDDPWRNEDKRLFYSVSQFKKVLDPTVLRVMRV